MILALILITIGIIIDQLTKYLAFHYLSPGQDYRPIPGLFRFGLVRNPGAAWGILAHQLWFFIIITVIALGVLGYLAKYFSFKENPIFSAAFILIVTGTIGNFIDRVVYNGLVRDFITFDFINFPYFNFADMALTVGVILLAIDILIGKADYL